MRIEMESLTSGNNDPQPTPTPTPTVNATPRTDSNIPTSAFGSHTAELNHIIDKLRESLSHETTRVQEAGLRINQLEGTVRMLEGDRSAIAAKMASMLDDQNKQIDEVLIDIALSRLSFIEPLSLKEGTQAR